MPNDTIVRTLQRCCQDHLLLDLKKRFEFRPVTVKTTVSEMKKKEKVLRMFILLILFEFVLFY